MPTQNQVPTQDQVVQAVICVYDYVLNPAVRGEFNRLLAFAKASPDNGSKVLQDFFDRQQYAATPDAFWQVFPDYEKNPLTPSLQATRLLRLTQEGNRKGDHQIFSLSSSNATPTQPLNPPGPLSRRTTRSVKIIAIAAVALLAAANTFARAENPTRIAREHHACAVMMGSINREIFTTPASKASIRPCLNWIKPNWFRRIEPAALERGSSLAHQLSQSAL